MSKKEAAAIALLALVIGLVVGYSVSIIVPNPLAAQKPTISLSSSTVNAGTNYTATLTGFPANTEIYGWTVNQQTPTCFVAGTTDANGKLVVSGTAPQATGTLPLVACNKDETIWAATSLTVK